MRGRRRALWGDRFGGATFLAVRAYLTGAFVFVDTYRASRMLAVSFLACVVTFVLGLASPPRGRGLVALAVCA